MRILVIEDDLRVAGYIVKCLSDAGHEADQVADGNEGLSRAMAGAYDAMIVDRMLPGLDGLSIIRSVREAGMTTPVMILSALGEVDDRVKGLRSGGDDYLVKPFAFAELLARIEIMARRGAQQEPERQETMLRAGDLEMDLISRTVKRGGKEIDLQTREFTLLEYMLRNKGRVITRAMLLEHVWHYHFDPQTNVIDVHISHLRGKIDKGFKTQLIRTVRGAGYIIDDPE